MRIDFSAINQACLSRFPDLLHSWLPGGRIRGREYVCGNIEGEPGESLSVNMENGTWSDFARADTGGKDAVSLYAAIHGLKQVEAARQLQKMLHMPDVASKNQSSQKTTWTAIIPVPSIAAKPLQQHYRQGTPSAFWTYRTAKGGLVGYVFRFDKADGHKEILPLVFAKSQEGKQAWRWMSFPVLRPLYRLDFLSQESAKDVLIVEGEKAADAAQRILPGFVAVTWPGGCNAVAQADFSPLQGRKVIIWPDADEPGIKAAHAVAEKAAQAGAASIGIIIPPANVKKSWDAADAESEGWTNAQIELLLASVAPSAGIRQEGPRPLRRAMPPASPFPLDALGNVLSGAAYAIHEVVKAPAAMCGQSVLAAAALAVQAYADITIDGRVSPVSLYALTWGESGERKSAVDNQALGPHRSYERSLAEKYDRELFEYEADSAAWKKEREQALSKAKTYEERQQALKKLGPPLQEPLQPILCVSDPSYEGLVKLMVNGLPSLGLFSDEGGKMLGGYAMSDDNIVKTAAGLSDFWDGKPIDRVRAGDGANKLYGRRLSLHLMAQPVVAEKIMSSPILSGQGFLSRCLPCWPESTAGSRSYNAVNLKEHQSIQLYSDHMLQILETKWPLAPQKQNELDPRQLEMTKKAKQRWIRFHDDVEGQLGTGKTYAPIKGFANKAAEHAARIAGVLALVEDIHCREIQASFIEAGIELCKFYLSEALRLYEAGTCDPDLPLAEKLLEWSQQQGEYIHLAQIYQLGPNALRDARTARRIAAILTEHGWLSQVSNIELDGIKRREVWQVMRT